MDKMKKGGGGHGFIDSVKSGEFMDNLKLSLEQLKGGNRQVLPEELKKKMAELDKQAEAFMAAQKTAEEEAMKLKRLTAALCSDAITMYKPTDKTKAAKPAPAAAEEKKSETPPAAQAEKPAEQADAKPDEAEASPPPTEEKSGSEGAAQSDDNDKDKKE